jgi:hypothetical protein
VQARKRFVERKYNAAVGKTKTKEIKRTATTMFVSSFFSRRLYQRQE